MENETQHRKTKMKTQDSNLAPSFLQHLGILYCPLSIFIHSDLTGDWDCQLFTCHAHCTKQKEVTTNFERDKERPTGQEHFFHTIHYNLLAYGDINYTYISCWELPSVGP